MGLIETHELMISKLILVEVVAFEGTTDEYFESIYNNEDEFLNRIYALIYSYNNKEALEFILKRELLESEMYEVGAIVLRVWKYIECGD